MKIDYPLEGVQALSVEEVVNAFQSDAGKGLSTQEAGERSKTFGLNVYKTQRRKSAARILLEQFNTPIVYLLTVGVVVSFYFNDPLEAYAILAVIFINAIIGFSMEMQARSTMHALREMEQIVSRVVRDGKSVEIPSEKIAPGDVILLEAGDVIPGDARLIEVNQMQCDESSLTGESMPTQKDTAIVAKDTPLGDQHNMVFKGTSVINGNGKAVITGIADVTQLGTITSLVETSQASQTPLDKKLNSLTKKLIWITLGMTSVFAVTGIVQGRSWLVIIETSVALAIAAIPEGLPIVATVALAYGMLLMARRNVIVKKLAAVETLGSTSVILTDKTGTLTENKITVERFVFPNEQADVKIQNNVLAFMKGPIANSKENFGKIITIGTLCNNALAKNKEEKRKALGDPIEIALLQLTAAAGQNMETIKLSYERTDEVPFNSEAKIMGTLHQSAKGNFVAAKGSVEDLLKKCSKTQSGSAVNDFAPDEKENVLAASEKMAAEGLRVLAFAYKEGLFPGEGFLSDLVYVGMIGFLDPPRLDIRPSIIACRKAGIKVVMITGDHPMTALNIARQTGLVDEKETGVVTGKDIPAFDSLSQEWTTKILSTAVFARATPKQKLEIAAIYQQAGNIVAMTGDGVNDAPALKKADVGIAMGQRGTAVAKETASIILKDDSFTSIAEAVEHGREIFQNIQKFVIYLVSCNLSEILIVTSLGIFVPGATLLPLQILFLNMITDVFPALALGLGKGDSTVMQKKPRDSKKDIVSGRDWFVIVLYALLMTSSVLGSVLYCKYYLSDNPSWINNVAFITLTVVQLFHVFNMSSLRSPFVVNEITKNKFVWLAILLCSGLLTLVYTVPQLRTVLGLMELSYQSWIVAVIAAFIPLLLIQAYKVLWVSFFRKTEVKNSQ